MYYTCDACSSEIVPFWTVSSDRESGLTMKRLVRIRLTLKYKRRVTREVTLQTLTSCALRRHKLDWWVIDILLLHSHYYRCCHIYSLLLFCRKIIRTKWLRSMVKALSGGTSPLTTRLSIDLLCECEIRDLTIIVCFFEGMLFSIELLTWGRQCRRGEAVHPSLLVLHPVSLRYTWTITGWKNSLERATRDLMTAYNTQIPVFCSYIPHCSPHANGRRPPRRPCLLHSRPSVSLLALIKYWFHAPTCRVYA
jgi:hypothetical protein